MYYVMETSADVIIATAAEMAHNESSGFKVVGSRKTLKGAERLAEKRCEL